MEREQILKALELHSQRGACLDECPYGKENLCGNAMARDALSLIRELTEENERLRAENAEQDEAIIKALQRMGEIRRETQADTVRRMQERLKAELNDVARWAMHGDENEYFIIGKPFIDQIAKEILEETK